MKSTYPSFATAVLLAAGSVSASPPLTVDIGATAPNAVGGHFGISSYLRDDLYWQARLEEEHVRADSRLSPMHHAMLGMGF